MQLFALFPNRSVRYALALKPLKHEEQQLGLTQPNQLAIDFYNHPSVGHGLIASLWSTENQNLPLYVPSGRWGPPEAAPPRAQISNFNHYWRTMGMWWAILRRAQFDPPDNLTAPINFPDAVKQDLVNNVAGVRVDANNEFDTYGQPVAVLPAIYQRVWQLYQQDQATAAAGGAAPPGRGARAAAGAGQQQLNFPPSQNTGEPYLNETEVAMLRVIADTGIGGPRYIRPFNKYHSVRGSSIFDEITGHIASGTSVFIDMSQANEVVRNNLVDRICRAIFKLQNDRFNSDTGVGDRFVMLHFEEAHRLFRADDKDMNILQPVGEGRREAQHRDGVSTQSMTTISPDLIKNTDNFLIAHLDDDREAREVARKYAFRELADDVQRIQSKGYVRMITRSHRFALPVQIRLFGPDTVAAQDPAAEQRAVRITF